MPQTAAQARMTAPARSHKRAIGSYTVTGTAQCGSCRDEVALTLEAWDQDNRFPEVGFAQNTFGIRVSETVTLREDETALEWNCPACESPAQIAVDAVLNADIRSHMGLPA